MPALALVDGELCDRVPVSDRGLGYGHGLFETIRVCRGQAPLWGRHLARLTEGAARLRIPLDTVSPHLEGWRDRILRIASDPGVGPPGGVLKLLVTAGSGERGYGPPSHSQPTTVLTWHPSAADSPLPAARLRVCQLRLADQPSLAGIKHLNRLEQVLARAEWQTGWDEGVMLDQAGHLVECVGSNLFLYLDGRWYTPALERAGVAGVMRNLLLDEVMPTCSQECTVAGDMTLDDLRRADELFICNAVTGIRPVFQVEDLGRWSGWPATDRLRQYLSVHYEYSAPC